MTMVRFQQIILSLANKTLGRRFGPMAIVIPRESTGSRTRIYYLKLNMDRAVSMVREAAMKLTSSRRGRTTAGQLFITPKLILVWKHRYWNTPRHVHRPVACSIATKRFRSFAAISFLAVLQGRESFASCLMGGGWSDRRICSRESM